MVERLSERTELLTRQFRGLVLEEQAGAALRRLQQAWEIATGRSVGAEHFAAQYAEAVACAEQAMAMCTLPGRVDDTASPWVDAVLGDSESWPALPHEGTSLTYFYEQFLQSYDVRQKSHHGVFYTPRPIAAYIVRQIHETLREEFGLQDGLADTTTWGQMTQRFPAWQLPAGLDLDQPFVRVLDPAMGSGAFLVEVVDVVHQTMISRWFGEGHSPDKVRRRWQRYVPQHLLPRLFGFELLLAPLVIAHLQLVNKLAQTGYPAWPRRLQLYLTDTLRDPLPHGFIQGANDPFHAEAAFADRARRRLPITVVLGNPPFSGISTHCGEWINRLLRGQTGDTRASYYEVDGGPLGERKVWLQDDYVKFLRYAQWCIERSRAGIVGFVTNHGYLDNATFRGMRQQIICAFSRISILDLHGNRKKRESSPHVDRDQNVFGVDPGVAIGLFRRSPSAAPASESWYGELWGRRAAKLAALEAAIEPLFDETAGGKAAEPNPLQPGAATRDFRAASTPRRLELAWQQLKPASPHYFLVPRDEQSAAEYAQGWTLNEIMPVNSTAAVTARDGFVIAWDKRELLARMRKFRDLSLSDDEIRAEYFTNSRSKKYLAGNTRGWKLTAARRQMAEDPDWEQHVRSCLYRPFDRRAIYWSELMIDWPRSEVMRHMLQPNLALISRRQMVPTQACNYFWVSDDIPLDGLIRSDNRGSESFFPLYLYSSQEGAAAPRRSNFASRFIEATCQRLSLAWTESDRTDNARGLAARDLLNFCYAQFHSATYRKRYAAELRAGFPRVFLTSDRGLFDRLCELGGRLVECHLAAPLAESTSPVLSIDRGCPKYEDQSIILSDDLSLVPVPAEVWNYQVGGHQVCRKWAKDRQLRGLSQRQLREYQRIVAAVKRTLALTREIERAIESHGGWPQAFCNA